MNDAPERSDDEDRAEPRRGFRLSMQTKISGLAFVAMLVLTIVLLVMENFKAP